MYKHFFETTHLMHEQTDSLTALEQLKNYFFYYYYGDESMNWFIFSFMIAANKVNNKMAKWFSYQLIKKK